MEDDSVATRPIEAELIGIIGPLLADMNLRTPGANYSHKQLGLAPDGRVIIEFRAAASWLLFALGFEFMAAVKRYYMANSTFNAFFSHGLADIFPLRFPYFRPYVSESGKD